MGSDFAGETAAHYARYRRDVPDRLVGEVVRLLGLSTADRVLDLGCGAGQLTVPLSRHVGTVVAVDPEPDMLRELRHRIDRDSVPNVLAVQGSDRDLSRVARAFDGATHPGGKPSTPLSQPFAALTIANALHWMDLRAVVERAQDLLRNDGAIVIVSQGPPMWLADAAWARDLRAFLEEWFGARLVSTCGTDASSREERRETLRGSGFGRSAVVSQAYENEIDVDYVLGHLGSAMTGSSVPEEQRTAFETGVREALRSHADDGGLVERIEAVALVTWRTE